MHQALNIRLFADTLLIIIIIDSCVGLDFGLKNRKETVQTLNTIKIMV